MEKFVNFSTPIVVCMLSLVIFIGVTSISMQSTAQANETLFRGPFNISNEHLPYYFQMFNSSNTCINEDFNLFDYEVCPAEKPLSSKNFSTLPCNEMQKFNTSEFTSVILLNTTELMAHLASHSSGMCSVVLFYALWCPFSMQIALPYNALGRIFSGVPIIAVDVVHQVAGYTPSPLRYLSAAVPSLLVFSGNKALGKYNESQNDINSIVDFVSQYMDVGTIKKIDCEFDNATLVENDCCSAEEYKILEQDYLGPMPVKFKEGTDWILYLSIFFLLFAFYFLKLKR